MDEVKSASKEELEEIAREYDTRVDFDGIITRYAGRLIAPRVKGLAALECGAASGEMTGLLLESARTLDVVEVSAHYAAVLAERFGGKIAVHQAAIEEFRPPRRYDAIVVAGLLHHLADPFGTLQAALQWVGPAGLLFVTVPNMLSMHRRLGVAMKVVQDPYATSQRNRRFRQPGRFDPRALKELVEASGWRVLELGGFLVKPFPHELMERFDLPSPVLDGLFELGRQFPDLAAQIFLVAAPGEGAERVN